MFRIEIFDQNLDFVDASAFTAEVSEDYYTMDSFSVTLPKLNVKPGYFAHVYGIQHCDFIVSEVEPNEKQLDVGLRPLVAITDIEFYAQAGKVDATKLIYDQLRAYYVTNSDIYQRLPMVVTNSSSSVELTIDEGVINLSDIVRKVLSKGNVYVECWLDFSVKKISATIKKVTDSFTVEADLKNVHNKEITLGEEASSNKVIYRNGDTGELTEYYLHNDGTVSTSNTDRVVPVRCTFQTCNANDWTNLQTKAEDLLKTDSYNNEIRLTFKMEDSIVEPRTRMIGSKANIRTGGTVFESILTGKLYTRHECTLIFGVVRVELTKRLILERSTL